MEDLFAHLIAAFADCRVAGWLVGTELIDQHAVQTHTSIVVGKLLPAHEVGRGADTMTVWRFSGDITRELAASLDHDAQTPESENFQWNRRGLAKPLHLLQ
ncbi:hypothetical protein D3C81_1953700 [compost metagenome]